MSSNPMIDNLPPQNLEAERCVLGAILLDSDCLMDVSLILDTEDFYREAHRTLYRAILEIWNAQGRVDAVLLADHMVGKGVYKLVGGDEMLMEVCNSVPHAANVLYHAEVVKQHSVRRQVIQTATEVVRDGYSGLLTARELLDTAQQKLFAIGRDHNVGQVYSMTEAVQIYAQILERRRQGEIEGLSTGFPDLDELIMGMGKKQLIYLAGRPGQGKTILGMNIAWHVASMLQGNVLFISLEMPIEELTERLVSQLSGIDSKRLKHPYLLNHLTHDEDTRVIETLASITQAKLKINDCSGQTVGQIASLARRQRSREGLELLVIDYLGKIRRPDHENKNTNDQITDISNSLKDLTGELGIPILCLHQLNRDSVKEGTRPQMHHLRDSGSLEQDAHHVWLLHNQIPKADMVGPVELIVEKNRNGPTGIVHLTLEKQFTRFTSSSLTNI